MIKVIIADDHDIVIEGVKSLLKDSSNIVIVGEAKNGESAISLIKKSEIDIAILDISMPGISGIDVAIHIQERYPNVKILMLTMHDDPKFIKRTLRSGASGYILKNQVKQQLIEAIMELSKGNDYYGNKVKDIIMNMHKSEKVYGNVNFTTRELEVLKLIANGYSTPDIAKMLCRAKSTVDSHRKNLIEKTGLKNSKELICFAIKNGYD
ncbi:LuxR family two component transcriptional regulator [Kordia periserrulae]|uniref:LuxR family two component transcriptional regulator n=1 Tax=Kordia periserrulae TaxID=701523 RepID=A0A2T6BYE2_9FLAO|nr:response regulator transcription factor [Kordia periserrulae]PTX61095.1 LuxR family two component transcriptional regulator [Kordia periserrulae]